MTESFDILVAGAGCGGICAAIQAARQGAKVLLVERYHTVGGTGVHSPVALVCKFQRRDTYEPINVGLHKELFPHAYNWRGEFDADDLLPTYDHEDLAQRYEKLIQAEPNLELRTSCSVRGVKVENDRVTSVELDDGTSVTAKIVIDATAEGHLAAMAGAPFQKGRPSDGAMQSVTLTFALRGFDPHLLRNPAVTSWGGYWSLNEELSKLYREAKEAGETTNPKHSVTAFAYPDGQTLLFNSNEVPGIDPTIAGDIQRGKKLAEEHVRALVDIVRRHPAFAHCEVAFISPWLGVREGRRIVGDHILSGEECLAEARFDDAVAAGAYDIDIHDPDGGAPTLTRIPNTQYYHIPYRSLLARDHQNLLMASRCISGDFIAHSSYRVMSTITAVGQAAGCAAALSCDLGVPLRQVDPRWIRHELHRFGQWTEGERQAPVSSF